jgi:hypothetical protein
MASQVRLPDWELQALLAPPEEYQSCTAQLFKLAEQRCNRTPHSLIIGLNEIAQVINLVACRRQNEELSPLRFGPPSFDHPVN